MIERYGRDECRAAARELLRGIFTAPCLPVTQDGKLDEAGFRADLRHCLDVLETSGLYINGYYGHFWLLDVATRRRVVEIAVDEVAGTVPVIARCAHPSPYEAVELAQHAERAGATFVSLVLPTYAHAHRDVRLGYLEMVARETDLGITVLNTPQAGTPLTPEQLAELVSIPTVCALKNGMPVAHTIRVRELVGDELVVVDPSEENLLVNMTQFGQPVVYTGTNMMFDSAAARPMRDYVHAALAGDTGEATRGFYAMEPVRAVHRRWVLEPWQASGLCPVATVEHWTAQLGMTGGFVPECLPELDEERRRQLERELANVGLIDVA